MNYSLLLVVSARLLCGNSEKINMEINLLILLQIIKGIVLSTKRMKNIPRRSITLYKKVTTFRFKMKMYRLLNQFFNIG
ncbi:hypothetical protein C1N51_05580 [Vibrio campbellii]|nr:hypothetical protein C1N51_05580 [Vibrio campbellii]